MTAQNLLEIKTFLQKKKLSSGIMMELYDHFAVQISELMKNGMSFQEAFIKTKLNWESELKMVKADFFSFKKIAKIEKDILQRRFRYVTLYGVAASLLSWFVYDHYNGDLILIVFFFGTVLLLMMMFNFVFKNMSFKEYLQLSFHPLIIRNQLLAMLFVGASYAVNKNPYFWEPSANHIFLIFAMMIQIQLLYLRTKKINILIA